MLWSKTSDLTWNLSLLSGHTHMQYIHIHTYIHTHLQWLQSSPLNHVISSVPQGTVLGPLLFLIYINDLPNRGVSSFSLFADDCLMYIDK